MSGLAGSGRDREKYRFLLDFLLKNNDFRKVLIVDTQLPYFRKLNSCEILDNEDINNCLLSTMNERLNLLQGKRLNKYKDKIRWNHEKRKKLMELNKD